MDGMECEQEEWMSLSSICGRNATRRARYASTRGGSGQVATTYAWFELPTGLMQGSDDRDRERERELEEVGTEGEVRG
jgi:hypothetical protein